MCSHSPLSVGLGLLALLLLVASAEAAPRLYVATDGRDTWSGQAAAPNAAKTDGPFATLERARDEIRKLKAAGKLPDGGLVVELRPGVYELSRPFELTAADSGTEACPITYRSRPGTTVRLLGGKVVTGWQPVTDPAVVKRLDPAAQGKVLVADLQALGVKDWGAMQPGQTWGASSPGLEVFCDSVPMTLARWPNAGYVTIPQVYGERPQDIRGTKGFMDGILGYEGDRPERWVGEKDIMLEGYWFWDWADQRLKVQSIDTAQKRLTLEPKPQHSYGFRKGMYYYAYNLLPELDQPGEWYLDREQGLLYFWPPDDDKARGAAPLAAGPRASANPGQVMISLVPSLVQAKDLANVTFRGLSFECTRGTALSLGNVTGVRVVGCTICNTGSWAVGLSGKDSGVQSCDLYNTADGGVTMSGGDRKTLTPAHLYVDNCHITRYGRWNPICKPGVQVDGVGNRVSHNLINDGPHMAIMWGGNDHTFEYNELHSVVRESNDAGIMYAGFNPTMRGHQIRYNYFHHVYGFASKGCNGVYLDDMFCSATIYGNIFYQVPRAAFIGGGHDNVVENNVFVDCKPALHVDARMLGWASGAVGTMKQRLEEMPYQNDLWRSRYPQLLTYLEGNYAEPRGNLVDRNICWGGSWDEIEGKARPGVKLENNLVGEDPRFVSDLTPFATPGTTRAPLATDFNLKPDSPALKLGFEPIPAEKIGLYKDDYRPTWPVVTVVRYPDTPPAPPKPAGAVAPKPSFTVKRLAGTVKVDGDLQAAEWNGLPAADMMTVAQGLEGEPVKPASKAWLYHDGTALYVAVDNAVDPSQPLRMGDTWGSDDCTELAFKNPALGLKAPLLILRGFPSGHFVSSDEAGAPPEAVKQAAQGVQFAAKVLGKDRWVAEWRIPFAALGIDPAKGQPVPFSLTVRKTAGGDWVLWTGTHHATWNVDNAGFLVLK